MDALIVYPENRQQLDALKAVMKAMKVSFEQKKEVYPDHVLAGVKEALQQIDEGKGKPYKGMMELVGKA